MNWYLRKPMDMKVQLYVERVQLLNTYLKEFPPFNNYQLLPDNAVVEITYHGLSRTWKDFLLMQGPNKQEGNIATLFEISQQIKTVEEWSKTKKAATGKRDCSVSKKSDKPSNKKEKTEYYCEYHGPSKSHGIKDCTLCLSILQSARKLHNNKHGSDQTSTSSNAGSDSARRITFKKP